MLRKGTQHTDVLSTESGYLDHVKELIARWAADVHAAPKKADAKGHSEVVRCLLEHGADVHVDREMYGMDIVLWYAAAHTEVLRELLRHGASPRDKYASFILCEAAQKIEFRLLSSCTSRMSSGSSGQGAVK